MKEALLLGGIGIASVVLIGYNFVYVPQQNQVKLIQAQVTQEQTNQATQAEVAALLLQVERYRKRLPEEPDPSWLTREVVALAQKSGVQLTFINQEPSQSFEQFTRLAVNLQFHASYHRLGSFIDEIERSEHFIRVEQLIVSPSEKEDSAAIQLILSTLFVPPVVANSSG
jgi:Tfp pilus assembly protein PilO